MTGHIHLGVLQVVTIGVSVGIWNFFMRTLAGLFHENAFGRALAYLW